MKNPVLDKIKKLLRMRRGGTPAEIETALRLAKELADKHGIDIHNVKDEEDKTASSLSHGVRYSRWNYDGQNAAQIIERFFNVELVWFPGGGSGHLTFVGRAFEVEIAIYIFGFLIGLFNRSWRTRSNKRIKDRRSFCFGVYRGIVVQLEKQQGDPDQGLVLSRKSYLNQLFPGLETKEVARPTLSQTAAWAGYDVGKNTAIRKGMSGSDLPSLPPSTPHPV